MCSTLDCINSVAELIVSFTGDIMLSLLAIKASSSTKDSTSSTVGSTYSSDEDPAISDTDTKDPVISIPAPMVSFSTEPIFPSGFTAASSEDFMPSSVGLDDPFLRTQCLLLGFLCLLQRQLWFHWLKTK